MPFEIEFNFRKNEDALWLIAFALLVIAALVGMAQIGQNATPMDSGTPRLLGWSDWQLFQAQRAYTKGTFNFTHRCDAVVTGIGPGTQPGDDTVSDQADRTAYKRRRSVSRQCAAGFGKRGIECTRLVDRHHWTAIQPSCPFRICCLYYNNNYGCNLERFTSTRSRRSIASRTRPAPKERRHHPRHAPGIG